MYKPADKFDKLGNQIPVSYFGDLDSKLDLCTGYVRMYNQIAQEKNQPQLNMIRALEILRKQHDKFYGMDNKYDGKGNLRG